VPASFKVAEDELCRVPEKPLGLLKPLSVSVMFKLVLPGVPAGMEIAPVSDRIPPPGAPDQLLLPPSPENWYAEPSTARNVFKVTISTVP